MTDKAVCSYGFKEKAQMILNIKIMVVEDDPWNREFLVDTLKCCVNRNISEFDNSMNALEAITKHIPPHLIIADRNLPGIDGFEFLAQVKTHFPDIVFVLTSCDPQDYDKAEMLGADAFMAAPYTEADVFKVVDHFVAGSV